MDRYPAPIKHAIRELGYLHAHAWMPDAITADHARDYVDDDVLQGWWAMECANTGPYPVLRATTEALESMPEPKLRQAFTALIAGHPEAIRLLRDHFVEHVAKWLAAEANQYSLNLAPTDEEMMSRVVQAAARASWGRS